MSNVNGNGKYSIGLHQIMTGLVLAGVLWVGSEIIHLRESVIVVSGDIELLQTKVETRIQILERVVFAADRESRARERGIIVE